MTGRRGTLKPDQTTMCTKCNQRLPPAGESICSTCLIHAKRGIPVPDQPLRPGQTPPPPRTPGYDKKLPPQK